MSSRATAVAPSNIAFIKYWGARDPERALPFNPSISMTLSQCVSRCTVEYLPESDSVQVLWRDREGLAAAPGPFAEGVIRHVERLCAWAGTSGGFRIATENSFPTGAGMASSASGFAALTLATAAALGRTPTAGEASILARSSGSGSAARSVLGGFVEWPVGSQEDPAAQIASADHWQLSDVVAVVSLEPKETSSREGHRRAPSSPFFDRRQEVLPERLDRVRRAIAERDISLLGPVLEEEALELHLVAMSSSPPIFYWNAGTIAVLRRVRAIRRQGLSAFATIDAGPNVHVICPSAEETSVAEALGELEEVDQVIVDRVGSGPYFSNEHLV
jgi:diphosphomevalonate decarboxylase